jgi:hypothetical protein
MQTIANSKFKATCLAVLERVRKTRQPLVITRFGKSVAEVHPPAPAKQSERKFGGMKGTAKILGDIVGPVCDPEDWEVLRD